MLRTGAARDSHCCRWPQGGGLWPGRQPHPAPSTHAHGLLLACFLPFPLQVVSVAATFAEVWGLVRSTLAQLDLLAAFAEVAAAAPAPYTRPLMLPETGKGGRQGGRVGTRSGAGGHVWQRERLHALRCRGACVRLLRAAVPAACPSPAVPTLGAAACSLACRGGDCAAGQPAPLLGGARGSGLHPQRLPADTRRGKPAFGTFQSLICCLVGWLVLKDCSLRHGEESMSLRAWVHGDGGRRGACERG